MSPTPSKSENSIDKTLFLVDISSFIFRAFFGIRRLTNKKGEPTNAIYGVATMFNRLLEESGAKNIAIVYDSKESSFRKEIYEDYKANRSEPPEDLIPQFDKIEELITLLGVPSFRKSGIEADDIIACLTMDWAKQDRDHQVVIVSGDKDLMALVTDQVSILDTLSNKVYHEPEVIEKFGVKPSQIRDYLALVGDSSDNIPGVPSIGPKTAAELLKAYEDLEGVLSAAQAGKITGKKGEVLKTHIKDARLSQKLATLKTDLPVKAEIHKVGYEFKVSPSLVNFLKEQDFGSLVTKWAHHQVSTEVASQSESADEEKKDVQFHTVRTEAQFNQLCEKIEKKGEFGFDLETTSLNPREAQLVGVAIAVDDRSGYYIPVGHAGFDQDQLKPDWVLARLKKYLENPKYKKIGQNLKYDWSVLFNLGISPDGIGADTMVADYVLDPDGRHNLETLADKHFNYTVLKFEDVCGKGKNQISFDQVPIDTATRYSAEDAWMAFKLWHHIKKQLQAEKLMPVFAEIDLPLVPVLARMECAGVRIDEAWLAQLSQEFAKELHKIETKIAAFTSGPINLNSPKQLAQLLFEELKLPPQSKTKTGYSTDASVLEVLAPLHEVPRLLLEYREIAKLKGTYVDPLPLLKDKKTGLIHAGFHQTVAATGRLSSSDPNLQNIPIRTDRGKMIRKAFIPRKGHILMAADYSQIELRLLAHMSEDKELVKSFKKGEDVHRRTASEIFSVEPDSVTDDQRAIAKAINFGLMYGKTPFGLAQELGISRTQAKETIDKYFERYSGVKKFLDSQIEHARETGWSSTLSGRKRILHDIKSANPAMRGFAERMAMNTPIQGTAADMIKLAMIELDEQLRKRKMKSQMIIQVHDELVLDCPEDEIESAKSLMIEVMENAMKLSVPLVVNVGMGKNWAEL